MKKIIIIFEEEILNCELSYIFNNIKDIEDFFINQKWFKSIEFYGEYIICKTKYDIVFRAEFNWSTYIS